MREAKNFSESQMFRKQLGEFTNVVDSKGPTPALKPYVLKDLSSRGVFPIGSIDGFAVHFKDFKFTTAHSDNFFSQEVPFLQ